MHSLEGLLSDRPSALPTAHGNSSCSVPHQPLMDCSLIQQSWRSRTLPPPNTAFRHPKSRPPQAI
ncbi:hypothetical protein ACQ4M4_07120 [Leptolyngbya sp. AN02str]|uniref:hypothetical protein n=1 Tax=Leptolyngbya sp. AN02str TaxID=3423363 RepID=UPI003D31E3F0